MLASRTFVVLFLFVAACASSDAALEPRFVAVHNAMTAMGLAQSGAISEGSLAQGAESRLDVELLPGECTTFVVLGGSGVKDVTLRVVGEGGEELARDATHDRQAAVQICPSRGGAYQVVVSMTEGGGGYSLSSWSGSPRGGGFVATTRGPTATATGPGSCSEPYPLEPGRQASGDTNGGGSAMRGSCTTGDSDAPERVYRLEVEQRSQVSIHLQSSYDGALYVLQSCGDLGSEVDCNDDAPDTNNSRIERALDPGTYFVVVDGYGDASGTYDLIASISPLQPVSQICAAASSLSPGRAFSGTTTGTPDYFQATCAGGARSGDKVHRLDVPTRSRVRVRQQSDHDGALYLRSDCTDPNSEIACNDDFGDQRRSLVSAVVDPGQYFIYSDGFTGQGQAEEGNFSVTAELTGAAGGNADGDRCRAPARLSTGESSADTFEAASDVSGSCGGADGPDVVYELDVRARSRLRVKASESEFAGAMYLQRRCGDASTEVACTAIPSSLAQAADATLDALVTPGRYFFVVDGADAGAFGAVKLDVQLDDLQALERTCRGAPLLRPGRTVNGDTNGKQDDFQATCAGNAQSPDEVYRVRVTRRSHVRVRMSSDYDGALHLRRDCADPATELSCNDDAEDNRHSMVEADVEPGTYFVVVDGFRTGSQGSYSLDLEVTNP